MNAAARAIHKSDLFTGHLLEIRLSKSLSVVLLLLLSLLLSGLSIIYVTNEHRISVSQLQNLEREAHELQLQRGQLLLEQASLSTPARVEHLAIEKLRMKLPIERFSIPVK